MATEVIRDATQQAAAALDTLTTATTLASESELLSVLLVCEGLTRKIDAISTTAIGTLDDQGARSSPAATAAPPAP